MSLVVFPGAVGPLRPLVAVLREQHEDRREQYRLDTAFREKHGVPSTPDIDWAEERRRVAALAEVVELQDPAACLIGFTAGVLSMQQAPVDPGEFVEPKGLAGISIAPRHLGGKESKALRAAWHEAVSVGNADAIRTAQHALVARGLCAIELEVAREGETGRERVDIHADVVEGLEDAGLLPWLLNATLYLQSLPSGKAYRSGVQPPQT